MKNLKLHKSSLIYIDELKNSTSALIINIGEFCYATNYAIWRLKLNDEPHLEVDLSTAEIYIDQDVKIVSYTYMWNSVTIVGCSNGDVITSQDNILDIVYKSEEIVVEISCSPDDERIILLTDRGHVTLMDVCFEAINNFYITEIDLTEVPLVNVGWGKKETQFHGSEGKNKRVVKEIVGDGDNVDDSINICWRSDSLLFAIGYFNKVINLRSIKIFNKDGVLQYISEPLSGVEATLSWKTTKELITFPQSTDGKYYISFMEKNGLKHGEFIIPSTINVKQLLWNHDASILCIYCMNDNNYYLLFLTCTNYTWQIKKWMQIENKIITVKWLSDNSLQLITSNGIYYMLYWVEMLCTSSPGTQDWVAVIDYCSVLLTPFKQVIIPPPMFDVKLTLDSPVDSVLYLPNNEK